MNEQNPQQIAVQQQYGGRIRLRVCGLLVENEKLLLICHHGLNATNRFWSPPGGGVEFGETLVSALQREFSEETNLGIEVHNLVSIREFINHPLHAVEFFFEVKRIAGMVSLGTDPEATEAILGEICWLSFDEIKAMPTNEVHHIFQQHHSLQELLHQRCFIE